MNIDHQKLELIQLILGLRDDQALSEVKIYLNNKVKATKSVEENGKAKRQFGFAKGLTQYVAPDFDDTPPGFEACI